MCRSHWSAKYWSGSPGQGTWRVSTARRSTLQGLDVEGLIVEDIWKGDVSVKVNGVQNIGQGHLVSTSRRSTMQGLVWLEVLHLRRSGTLTYINSKSLQPKYRSRSPGQGICQVSTLRRSTLQGLMAVGVGLTVEEISNVDAKCVKVNGAQNIG